LLAAIAAIAAIAAAAAASKQQSSSSWCGAGSRKWSRYGVQSFEHVIV
jgi:hypothetical protein